MKFSEFVQRYGNNPLIDIHHVKLAEKDFAMQQLSQWTHKGYLKKLSDRYRLLNFPHFHSGDISSLIANQLVQPSYLSLERALRRYNVIPEHVTVYTSCTTQKTKIYQTDSGVFQYQTIKPSLYRGYTMIDSIAIADCEKALCDYLYLHGECRTIDDLLEGLRWNIFVLQDRIDQSRLIRYMDYYPSTIQTLLRTLLSLL